MKPATHGGARRNAGRPKMPDWKLCGFRLEIDTFERVQQTAQNLGISQSALVNEILKRILLSVS
jgi:hypothetical protein